MIVCHVSELDKDVTVSVSLDVSWTMDIYPSSSAEIFYYQRIIDQVDTYSCRVPLLACCSVWMLALTIDRITLIIHREREREQKERKVYHIGKGNNIYHIGPEGGAEPMTNKHIIY